MRVTGFWSAVGLLLTGVIIADLVANPGGTNALGNFVVGSEKPALNALLGKPS